MGLDMISNGHNIKDSDLKTGSVAMHQEKEIENEAHD